MAALPETHDVSMSAAEAGLHPGIGRQAGIVVPLRPENGDAAPLIDSASGARLGSARGLLLGLAIGATLWLGIGLLAWRMFRHVA